MTSEDKLQRDQYNIISVFTSWSFGDLYPSTLQVEYFKLPSMTVDGTIIINLGANGR